MLRFKNYESKAVSREEDFSKGFVCYEGSQFSSAAFQLTQGFDWSLITLIQNHSDIFVSHLILI